MCDNTLLSSHHYPCGTAASEKAVAREMHAVQRDQPQVGCNDNSQLQMFVFCYEYRVCKTRLSWSGLIH